MQSLVEAGATAEVIGAFALSYPAKVTALAGKPQADEVPVDLVRIINQAVQDAVGLAIPRKAPRSPSDIPLARFTIVIDGQRTSVTLPRATVNTMEKVLGSRKEVGKLVNALGAKLPPGIANRSGWITRQLQDYAATEENATQRAH